MTVRWRHDGQSRLQQPTTEMTCRRWKDAASDDVMDKVNQKMRKFNLRGVLIGLRATALGNSPHKLDSSGIEETLRSEHFQVAKVRHRSFSAALLSDTLSRFTVMYKIRVRSAGGGGFNIQLFSWPSIYLWHCTLGSDLIRPMQHVIKSLNSLNWSSRRRYLECK